MSAASIAERSGRSFWRRVRELERSSFVLALQIPFFARHRLVVACTTCQFGHCASSWCDITSSAMPFLSLVTLFAYSGRWRKRGVDACATEVVGSSGRDQDSAANKPQISDVSNQGSAWLSNECLLFISGRTYTQLLNNHKSPVLVHNVRYVTCWHCRASHCPSSPRRCAIPIRCSHLEYQLPMRSALHTERLDLPSHFHAFDFNLSRQALRKRRACGPSRSKGPQIESGDGSRRCCCGAYG